MNVAVEFDRAPPVGDWVAVVASRGWKVTEYDADRVRAKKRIGQSEFPVRLATTWRLTITDEGEGTVVDVAVPAFAESLYARRRILGFVREVTEALDGECETDTEFDVDVLGALREGEW